jgi:hypothetical protein
MPVTVENKSAKEILKEIEEGKWDNLLKEGWKFEGKNIGSYKKIEGIFEEKKFCSKLRFDS